MNNGFTSPMNMNNPTGMVQNTLQYSLLNKFTTGDPFWDPLIHMFIYSAISVLIFNLQNILSLSWLKYYLEKVFSVVKYYYYTYVKKEDEVIDKKVVIDYITDNKKVNNLYKAVDWYLSTKYDTDFIKESPLKLSYEEDPSSVKLEDININRRITQNKYKSLVYRDHEIFYILNNNIITVYTDKERKRENYSITLTTKMKRDSEIDILDDFCKHCIDEFVKSKRSNVWIQKIYVNDSQGKWVSQESNNRRKIDTVVLQDGTLEDVKRDIDDFMNSEDWYHDRDIPYTRGYLFYGLPGTGKTSLIKGISTYTKRHMHYLMLNNVQSDNQLLEMLRDIKYKDTILIIEDIDCMTDIIENRNKKNEEDENGDDVNEDDKKLKKKIKKLKEELKEAKGKQDNSSFFYPDNRNTSSSSKLTLSGLLNAIDGIFNNDGRILIMTTNHPEVLDDALIRSGRVDRKIYFDYCSKYQIRDIYKMMFNKECPPEQLEKIEGGKYSPADITSLFLRYRSNPEFALPNIEKMEARPVIAENRLFSKHVLEDNANKNDQVGNESMFSNIFTEVKN